MSSFTENTSSTDSSHEEEKLFNKILNEITQEQPKIDSALKNILTILLSEHCTSSPQTTSYPSSTVKNISNIISGVLNTNTSSSSSSSTSTDSKTPSSSSTAVSLNQTKIYQLIRIYSLCFNNLELLDQVDFFLISDELYEEKINKLKDLLNEISNHFLQEKNINESFVNKYQEDFNSLLDLTKSSTNNSSTTESSSNSSQISTFSTTSTSTIDKLDEIILYKTILKLYIYNKNNNKKNSLIFSLKFFNIKKLKLFYQYHLLINILKNNFNINNKIDNFILFNEFNKINNIFFLSIENKNGNYYFILFFLSLIFFF